MTVDVAPARAGEKIPTRHRLVGLAVGLTLYVVGASGFFFWAITAPTEGRSDFPWSLLAAWSGALMLVAVAPLTASMVSLRSWRVFRTFDLKIALLTVVIGLTMVVILANLPPASTYAYPEWRGLYIGPHGHGSIWFFSVLTLPLAILFCLVMKFIAEVLKRKGAIVEIFWKSGEKPEG